jgi:SPP1 family predicted phage head-tail adaptor
MIGKLRHRVIFKEATETTDGQGGVTSTWSTVATVWAEIRPILGIERYFRGGTAPNITHLIKVRYRSDLSMNQRIYYGTRTFYIRGMRNLTERDKFLELTCEEAA